MSTSFQPEDIQPDDNGEDDGPPRPFGFRFVVVLTAIYLAYRLVQGIIWVVHRLGG